jgi:hypothetical protein
MMKIMARKDHDPKKCAAAFGEDSSKMNNEAA